MTNKLDKAHLVPGAIVMVGPSERMGRKDYSWTDSIWRVEAGTGDQILCRCVSRLNGYGDVLFMSYSERTWWQAEHVLEAYKSAISETAAEYAKQVADAKSYDSRMRERADIVIKSAIVS